MTTTAPFAAKSIYAAPTANGGHPRGRRERLGEFEGDEQQGKVYESYSNDAAPKQINAEVVPQLRALIGIG